MTTPVSIVPGKLETEIAVDIKTRITEAMKPVCALFDQAIAAGFIVQWDAVGPTPPDFKTRVTGLRLVKHF